MASARITTKGVRELNASLRDLFSALAEQADLSPGQKSAIARRAMEELSQYAGRAADEIRDEARRRAAAQNWPLATRLGIFSFRDPGAPKRRNKASALLGVRKMPALRSRGLKILNPKGVYVEWKARYAFTTIRFAGRRKAAKQLRIKDYNPAGKALGMGLGTIMEHGTINPTAMTRKRFTARPAFVPGVAAAKGPAMEHLADGYKRVIESIAKARPAT